MTSSSNMISDDFSDDGENAPTTPPKVPDGATTIPDDAPTTVYAPTSDKKPLHPDPLQRRG